MKSYILEEGMDIFAIGIRGPEIAGTDYWDSNLANLGMFFLSWNAGTARLLVPDCQIHQIKKMNTGKYVVISYGPWKKYGQDYNSFELMFEDHSESPFSTILGSAQTDQMPTEPENRTGFSVTVWSRTGVQLKLPGLFRVVDELPCLNAWKS